jgi:hypothetical protein
LSVAAPHVALAPVAVMLLMVRPGTSLGGIRSTTVNERWIRADRLGSRLARAHTVFAPRCGGRIVVVHDAAHAATPAGGGPRTKSDDVTGPSETSTIVACLCRMPLIVIFPCSSTAACASLAGTSTRSRMEAWFSSGTVMSAHGRLGGSVAASGRTLASDGVAKATVRTSEAATAVASTDLPMYRLRIFAPV